MANPDPTIRFDDGAAYEAFMGVWSRIAGEDFLDWLAPSPGLEWLDVGCGNGAFTALLVDRCAPERVVGIDPSQGQIDYARSRWPEASAAVATPAETSTRIRFDVGGAESLPCADREFDAAVMALVIFFVPDPALGVAEMARAVRPGGSVSTYAWDILGGGFPYAVLQEEMQALGIAPLWPPSAEASKAEALRALWSGAGLVDLRSHTIDVERTFDGFDDFWRIARTGPRLLPTMTAMADDDLRRLRDRVRERLAGGASGPIVCTARANAIAGRRPSRP